MGILPMLVVLDDLFSLKTTYAIERGVIRPSTSVDVDSESDVDRTADDPQRASYKFRSRVTLGFDYNPSMLDAAAPLTPRTTPVKLDLKRDEKLEIDWADGSHSVFSIGLLRSQCPCAQCKTVRQEKAVKKPLLQILPGNHTAALSALSASLIGNYALQIDWSDSHGSGIYSFQYLREIAPPG